MFANDRSVAGKRSWLLAACLMALGVLALVAAPAVFVPPAYAQGPTSCNEETPCPSGYTCCGGSCCDDSYYCCTVAGQGDACKICPCDCGCE